jgi:putative Mg2+ transporter-C (MgtC) family protein
VIFKDGLNVRDLNTAATLWCSAAVGLLAGEGLALYATLAAGLVIGVNVALRPLVKLINRQPVDSTEGENHYLVAIDCRVGVASDVRTMMATALSEVPDAVVQELASDLDEGRDHVEVTATLVSHRGREIAMEVVVARIARMPGVTRAVWRANAQAT